MAIKFSVCSYRDNPPGLNEDHHVGLYSVKRNKDKRVHEDAIKEEKLMLNITNKFKENITGACAIFTLRVCRRKHH